jgi:hypothetical protein
VSFGVEQPIVCRNEQRVVRPPGNSSDDQGRFMIDSAPQGEDSSRRPCSECAPSASKALFARRCPHDVAGAVSRA